jgi:hypothetical protein
VQNHTTSRLKNLIGKKGFVPVRGYGEIGFTILAVEAADESETDIERAINWSKFTVRLDEGTLIDGRDTLELLGLHISSLNGGDY